MPNSYVNLIYHLIFSTKGLVVDPASSFRDVY